MRGVGWETKQSLMIKMVSFQGWKKVFYLQFHVVLADLMESSSCIEISAELALNEDMADLDRTLL